jgi:hypothetical protein
MTALLGVPQLFEVSCTLNEPLLPRVSAALEVACAPEYRHVEPILRLLPA